MRISGQMPAGPSALVLDSLSVEAGLIRKWLEGKGYRVEVVAEKGGFEARVRETTPDLVVVAQVETSPAAANLCRDIRANEATRGVPVVLVATLGVPGMDEIGVVLLKRPLTADSLTGAVLKATTLKV